MAPTRQVAGLTWSHCCPEATDDQIDALARFFDVNFPTLFREVLRLCHGGSPVERSCFDYPHPGLGPVGSSLAAMLSIDRIPDLIRGLAYDDQLPARLVPFAEDGGGDLMCLDYREARSEPRVAYWMHEKDRDESAVVIAASFEAFLAMLAPFDEEAYEALLR